MADGRVIIPRGPVGMEVLARALGDDVAAEMCGQADMTEFVVGKPMCG